MSTRDETFVALRHFQKLRSLGQEIPTWTEVRDPTIITTRFINWLRETRETVRALLGADSYVLGELDKLMAESRSGPQNWDVVRQQGLELIGSAERLAALQSNNSISADLRRAIDTSVKEGYFSSWPVKAMLTAASVLLAILFGGTIYSTVKVDGVQRLAELAAQDISGKLADFKKQADVDNGQLQDEAKNVRSQLADFKKQADETNRQVQDEAKNVRSQIDEAVRAAAAAKIKDVDAIVVQAQKTIETLVKSTSDAIDTEKNNQIKAFRDAVSPAVDDAKTKLADYLRRAPDDVIKAIGDRRDGAIKAVTDDEAEARKVLDSRRVNAVTAIDGAEKAATNAIMNHQAAVNSARGTAETEMSQATGAINNLQKNTQTSINRAKEELEARGKAATEQIDKIVATIPERVRKTGDSVVALNDLLAKYEAPVTGVIARLQANKPQSTLDAIAAVLGSSVLLMAIALGLSVLAVVLSIVAMLGGTGRRGAGKLP